MLIFLVVLVVLAIPGAILLYRLIHEVRLLNSRVGQLLASQFDFDTVTTQLRKVLMAQQVAQSDSELTDAMNEVDRIQVAQLIALMAVVDGKVDDAATHAVAIAADLEAQHERANAADATGPTGAAADAAMRHPAMRAGGKVRQEPTP